MTKPEKCWNCGEKETMKLVKDNHNFKFYQCDNCGATDNGDKPDNNEKT